MTGTRKSQLSRRRFMSVAAGTLSSCVVSCASRTTSAPPRRPNVVFAFSDEHRYQSMCTTDMPELHTPAMARMNREGVHFTSCISNYPVCSPYRAMLMTGRWPLQQGVIDNNIALDPKHPSLGRVFVDAGYRTGYIGKWHLGGTRAEPFGFDESLIWTQTNTHWDQSLYHPASGDPVQPKGYNATLMTGQAIEFMTANANRPFFLMLSWNPPHSNFLDPPEDKVALYPQGSLKSRPNATITGSVEADSGIWSHNSWDHYAGYHAHISAIDDELARVIETLERLGIADNTILIYTSDHGSMFGSHGLGSKRQPYEESIRVPFMVRWPAGIPQGLRLDSLFGAIDIMPTLCGLAGIPVPPACAGSDFASAIRGGHGPDPESQLIMHISKDNASGGTNHPAPLFRGVRTKRYTYAVYPDAPWCLFDNQLDPYQMENLIDNPAHKITRRRLRATLAQALAAAGDPLQLPT